MNFKYYNSASGRQRTLARPAGHSLLLYSCGPTVYDRATLGNLRAMLVYDLTVRTLRWLGYPVRWVMNYTDVGHLTSDADTGEDKVARRAQDERTTAWDIANQQIELFERDLAALHILPPDRAAGQIRVRATERLAAMTELVERLQQKKMLYRTDDGLYFDTARFPQYGRLADTAVAGQKAGARVKPNPAKRQPTDFAVWKFSPAGRKRDMEWPNPLNLPGRGFPGWHLECSAIIRSEFGRRPVDLHLGGVDLRPIHHQNELAQSIAAYGQPFVRGWLHVAHLLVAGRRMGKSEGNKLTLDELIAKGFSPLDFRYFVCLTHYRQRQNFTWSALAAAAKARARLNEAATITAGSRVDEKILQRLQAAVAADLDLPRALATLWTFVRRGHPAIVAATVKVADSHLFNFLEPKISVDFPPTVKQLLQRRDEARQKGDWRAADAIRDQLLTEGWQVADTKTGPVVTRRLLVEETKRRPPRTVRRRIDAAVKKVVDEYGEVLKQLGRE